MNIIINIQHAHTSTPKHAFVMCVNACVREWGRERVRADRKESKRREKRDCAQREKRLRAERKSDLGSNDAGILAIERQITHSNKGVAAQIGSATLQGFAKGRRCPDDMRTVRAHDQRYSGEALVVPTTTEIGRGRRGAEDSETDREARGGESEKREMEHFFDLRSLCLLLHSLLQHIRFTDERRQTCPQLPRHNFRG